MGRHDLKGFIENFESRREDASVPSEEAVRETAHLAQRLLTTLQTLDSERARFREDLRQAVADGDRLLEELHVS